MEIRQKKGSGTRRYKRKTMFQNTVKEFDSNISKKMWDCKEGVWWLLYLLLNKNSIFCSTHNPHFLSTSFLVASRSYFSPHNANYFPHNTNSIFLKILTFFLTKLLSFLITITFFLDDIKSVSINLTYSFATVYSFSSHKTRA